MFAFALRLLRARPEAEDLLQEVFVQAWRQAASYRPERGSPEAWLLTITRSRGIDKLRSIRRRDGIIQPSAEEPRTRSGRGTAESGAPGSEAKLVLGGVLASLSGPSASCWSSPTSRG